jgi:hypothetical protein
MDYQDCLSMARNELQMARQLILDEMRDYPTPISGCDAQFNHLLGLRSSISDAIRALEAPKFVATPRTLEPAKGVESR